MIIPQQLLSPFSQLLNRTVQASTPARRQLDRLEGRSFAVQVDVPGGLRLVLSVAGGQMELAADDREADTTVYGTPLALLAMTAPLADLRLRTSRVRIEGDAETAQAFRELLSHAHPDLEAEVARHMGEGPAHHALRIARGVFNFGKQTATSFAANTAEYLTEETHQLPPRAEAEVFMDDVDRLREGVDRAEARLRLLEARAARARS